MLALATKRGLTEITDGVSAMVRKAAVQEGLCTVFLRHTSASLVMQENADPSVRRDLEACQSRRIVAGGQPLTFGPPRTVLNSGG